MGKIQSEDTAKDEDAEDQPRFGGDQFFDESDDSDNNEIENSDSEANSVTVKKTNHSLDKTNYLPFSDSGSKDDGSREKFQKTYQYICD